MVRIARQRVGDLFALAEREAATGHAELANRYVRLARRIGMRYNVRLLAEYRDLYCRECSAYWTEGRNVRTRLRRGHRVRTCLACGRERRTRTGSGSRSAYVPPSLPPGRAAREEVALAGPLSGDEDDDRRAEEEADQGD